MAKYFEDLKNEYKSAASNVVLEATNIDKIISETSKEVESYDLATILEHLSNTTEHTTHILVDETDGSLFTKEYSQRIKKCLEHESFNNATVVLAMQSTKESSSVHNESTTVNIVTHCLDDVDTGMVLLPPLGNCMRMVGNVFKLKEIAEQNIVKKPSVLALHAPKPNVPKLLPILDLSKERSSDKDLNIIKPATASEKLSTLTLKSAKGDKEQITKTPTKKEVPNKHHEQQSSNQKTTPPKSATKSPSTSVPLGSPNYNLLRLSSHPASIFLDDLEGASQGYSTKFEYPESRHGVNIEGEELPKVIYLNDDFNLDSGKSGIILANVLEQFVDEYSQTTVICNSIKEAKIMLYSSSKMDQDKSHCFIPHLEEKIPTYEDKRSIWDEVENSLRLLITDYRGFRGCEAENCITFIDQDEKYARHVLVEVFARAVELLSIFVFLFYHPRKLKLKILKKEAFDNVCTSGEKRKL